MATNARTIPFEWVPTLPRRYATTVIDGMLVLVAIAAPIWLWPANDSLSRSVRIVIAILCLLVYEPFGTGRFVTIGQAITGVRVRRFDNGEKIGLARAYARIVVKILLGFVSFLTLPFTPGRRAMHDLATGSIVITANAEREYSSWASEPFPK